MVIFESLYFLKTCPFFDKAANSSDDRGGLLVLQALLNETVAEGVASNPHDFIGK